MNVEYREIPFDPSISYAGPDIAFGPLPALIYFSLSKEESLGLDPYNQPVQFLKDKPIRVFSFTLPGHGDHFDKNHAMQFWADEVKKNPYFFSEFIQDCSDKINFLIEQNIIDASFVSVAGLSRGCFIATHLAAENDSIKTILGFAPLTELKSLHEFQPGFDFTPYNLRHLNKKLIHKSLRFYIGNRDTRVGTESAFNFIKELSDTAFTHGIRSPQVELIISPSVGFHGHGTLPHIFQDGISWLIKQLKLTP